MQSVLFAPTVVPMTADVSKCDERMRFHVQGRFLWHFCGAFECSWATQELLHALLCVLLLECTICTPWGGKCRRHSRIALSGAYVIQAKQWKAGMVAVVQIQSQPLPATSSEKLF